MTWNNQELKNIGDVFFKDGKVEEKWGGGRMRKREDERKKWGEEVEIEWGCGKRKETDKRLKEKEKKIGRGEDCKSKRKRWKEGKLEEEGKMKERR